MNKIAKQILVYTLTFIMLFSSFITPGMLQNASAATVTVKKIILIKEYTTIENPNAYNMTIIGDENTNFNGVVVSYLDPGGKLITLNNPSYSSQNIVQYTIDPTKIGSILFIAGKQYDISETDMAKLTAIDPYSVKKYNSSVSPVPEEMKLTVQGVNFNKLSTLAVPTEYDAYYYDQITNNEINDELQHNTPLNIDKTGVYNMRFERNFTTSDSVEINISYRYLNIFRVYDDLENISNQISIFPNRGEKGSMVYFKAEQLRGDMSVFFLTKDDGTDQFTQVNKAKNLTYAKDAEGTLDIVTCTVPIGIAAGKEYFIFFTNYVPDTGDPTNLVYKYKALQSKFTVIDVGDKVTIQDIDPQRGPDTGQSIEVVGKYFGSLNINGLSPDAALTDPSKITISGDQLSLNYGDGTYNGEAIKDITKIVEVYIGAYASFEENCKAIGNYNKDKDRIYVKTPTMSIEKDLTEDVVVNTKTTFKLGSVTFKFEETDRFSSFTYQPSSTKPVIDKIVPGKVQIEKKGADYVVKSPTMMAVYGKDFKIYRETTLAGVVIHYPRIKITDDANQQITIDATNKQVLDYQDIPFQEGGKIVEPQVIVFDNSGRILDGSTGKETGTKILFTIPQGVKVAEPQPNEAAPRDVEVSNPIKNSDVLGLKATASDVIEFVMTDQNPMIEKVLPDTVTVVGGEEVIITGSRFLNGVKVYIDGSEVTSITRDGMGQTINFKAPPGREGTTQLQVINEGGGTAVWPFRYVKTYTNPKITDFNPKDGNTGTLVIIKGENFMLPNPSSEKVEVLDLIGTRVYLGEEDINNYNLDAQNHIILNDYANDKNSLLQVDLDTGLKYADYYDSVVLKDNTPGAKKHYILQEDLNGNLRLTDGVSNVYVLSVAGGLMQAVKEGGGTYNITVNDDGLTLSQGGINIFLQMQTPYTTEVSAGGENRITGNHVRVVDNKEIHFTVPILPATGYYDLKVVNPDTKQDGRLGKLGFYYYAQPQSKPVITGIVPAEGSTGGGYPVRITGNDFKDNGQSKSRVIINGIEVDQANVTVGLNGDRIDFIVPAYPGDLFKDKGVSSIKVAVVVINPDGAAASQEQYFTYIVPSSSPKILKITPSKGAAVGGEVVEITGEDFRFFEPYDDKNRNMKWDVGENFTDLNGNKGSNPEPDDFRDTSRSDLQALYEQAHTADSALYPTYDSWFQAIVVPVLPKVYFSTKAVTVDEFSDGYLKVKSPAGSAGKVDVFVVNNDTGSSNKVAYTYEASNLKISKIIPDTGKKQGRDNIEIFGSGFAVSNITVYDTLTTTKVLTQPLVSFGAITNAALQPEQENSGRIDNQRTTVRLEGGFTISYDGMDANNKTLSVTLSENNKSYTGIFGNYDDTVRYLNLGLLKTNDGTAYPGFELVRVMVMERRLIVERGYSPQVSLNSVTQIIVKTSSYHTIGGVAVKIVNPDGMVAVGKFTYKNPDSHPVIVNVTQNGNSPELMDIDINGTKISARVVRVNYKGKAKMSVIGQDFRDNAIIHIGDSLKIESKDITYQLPDKLSFTMPEVPESLVGKYRRVLVMNEDGAQASSTGLTPPIYIQFTKGDSDLEVSNVTPAMGPVSGSTVVLIEGKGFRDEVKGFSGTLSVYFGDKKASSVERLDSIGKTLRVISPLGVPGNEEIRVENPDGAISAPNGTFTYISTPKIIAVVNPDDPTENQRVREISIDGGQVIKIKGSGFLPGAKVVFAPETETVTGDTVSAGGNQIYRVGQQIVSGLSSSVVQIENLKSGSEGGDTKFIDAETLTVKVPTGQLDTKGIIVVNPDQGASLSYDELTYKLPGIEAPAGVIAEVVHDQYGNTDRYIKVYWQPVQKASQYDTYVSVDGGAFKFIGATKLTAFLYKDLKERTRYRFMIKSIGNFGSSPPSMTSNEVTTGRTVGAPDTDGKLDEKTQQSRSGNTAMVSIGTDDYNKQISTVDLTRGTLAGCKELVLTMPAEVVSSNRAQDILILGSDFSLRINPNAFNIGVLKQTNGKNAGVRFKISPATKQALSGSSATMSTIYQLEANAFVGSESTGIDYLARDAAIAIDENSSKMALWRIQNPALYRYDVANKKWDTSYNWKSVGTGGLATINRLGYYTVMGTRR